MEKLRGDEERKTIAAELVEEKALMEFEEQLTRERMSHSERLGKEAIERAIQMEQNLAVQKEKMRQEAAVHLQERRVVLELELEKEKSIFEKEKIVAEVRAKAEQERMNEDVNIRRLKLEASLSTQRLIAGIQTVSKHVAAMGADLVAKPQQFLMFVVSILSALALYSGIRELLSFLRVFIQSRLGRPVLVRETSYHRFSLSMMFSRGPSESHSEGLQYIENFFRHVVLSASVKERVVQLALSTRNTKRSGAPFRHVLLHGPPGNIIDWLLSSSCYSCLRQCAFL